MITKDEVKHIAELARIGISEKEVEKYSKDLSSILDWVEELKKVDVTSAESTAHITGLKNIVRADKADDFENKSKIVDLFPEKKERYDKVKSIF
ncbi:Asp-tRNA(Asn)/Glu-tRNA(Gln) amidotransferase subunit GatC [Patescibacteria group bacterium]|nr:Asp-tRNA(Asn)/Glu-tRNA(Gln) amidotransferase subunit GatC [Patescibacteria group bacterium]